MALRRLHPSSWLCLMGKGSLNQLSSPIFSCTYLCLLLLWWKGCLFRETWGKVPSFPYILPCPYHVFYLFASPAMGWLFSGRWNQVFELLLFLCIPVVHLCLLVLGWTGCHIRTCMHAYMHACACAHIHEGTNFWKELEDSERTGHRWSRCRFVRVGVWSLIGLCWLPSFCLPSAYAFLPLHLLAASGTNAYFSCLPHERCMMR